MSDERRARNPAADRPAADRPDVLPATHLGFPIRVERTATLPQPLSERAWNDLVEDLRDTFEARGTVQSDGRRRQWRNGNLRVRVEPAGSGSGGSRLHMRTMKDSARNAFTRGLTFAVLGTGILLFQFATGGLVLDAATLVAALSLAAGLGTFWTTARHLPRWREERARQMEAIAARTAERLTERKTVEQRAD